MESPETLHDSGQECMTGISYEEKEYKAELTWRL
jgi:hypothetical protein